MRTTAHHFRVLPGLGRKFSAGDGWTDAGSGSQPLLLVLIGAPRLFLGFAGADGCSGLPGQAQQNGGGLCADVQPFIADTNASPPLVFSESSSRLPDEGEDTTAFQVRAMGALPLTHQWLRDGISGGANDGALHLTNVRLTDAGNDVGVVTNLHGSATSAPMRLHGRSPEATILLTLPPLLEQWNRLADFSARINRRKATSVDPMEADFRLCLGRDTIATAVPCCLESAIWCAP